MTESSSGLDEAMLVTTYINSNSGVLLDRNGQPAVGSQWYLLSMQWYRRWQMYHGLMDRTGEEARAPGEIDNSDILLEREKYYCLGENVQSDRVLKPGVELDEDFILLPPTAWDLLSSRYQVKPGSIIPRFSIQQKGIQTTVEITLRELQLAIVYPGYILSPSKAMYVSRKLRVSGLYQHVKLILSSLPNGNTAKEISIWELDAKSNWDELKDRIGSREKSQLVEFPGGRLTTMEESMDDADLGAGQLLVAEVQGIGENWSFARTSRRFKCEICKKKFFYQGIRCTCKLVMGM